VIRSVKARLCEMLGDEQGAELYKVLGGDLSGEKWEALLSSFEQGQKSAGGVLRVGYKEGDVSGTVRVVSAESVGQKVAADLEFDKPVVGQDLEESVDAIQLHRLQHETPEGASRIEGAKMYTLDEVAAFLRVHERTLARLLIRGGIKGVKPGRDWRIQGVEVLRFLRG